MIDNKQVAHLGLSKQEVATRIAQHQQNTPPKPLTRSIKRIISDNTLTLFNLVNLVIGLFVFYTGSYLDLLFLFPAFFNTVIGIYQEVRAKRAIDSMSLLTQENFQVIRDHQIIALHQADIVLDDVLILHRGDSVPVDGKVIASSNAEVDESQLTGETDAILKQPEDAVYSGSFLLSGQLVVKVTAVGDQSFVSKLSNQAKQEKRESSELLNIINRIIKILTFVIIPVGILLFTSAQLHRGDLNRSILSSAAAMIGMIPEGLVLLTSVALAVGALNLSKRKVLVRSLSAIESLARVDTLCLDKTGTITTGNLNVNKIINLTSQAQTEITNTIAKTIYALNDDNQTANALKNFLSPIKADTVATIPFSSQRKWSGATFTNGQSVVIGAPEFIYHERTLAPELVTKITDFSKTGYRVLLVAAGQVPLEKKFNDALTPIALVLITDELRPNAAETFAYLRAQQVTIKVISGDSPLTVSNVASQAGIPNAEQAIDMSTQTETADYDRLVQKYTVFGRVSPLQKKYLITAYQRAGHTVGMTGDGVNDILALRQADCSIAMATGSESTQSIADFVLLNSDFNAMIFVLNEGRRVINNVERVASLYLIKTIYSVILSVLFIFFNSDYPYQPRQLTPINALTVGIPSFLLALEPNYQRVKKRFMRNVMETALPGALSVVLYAVIIHIFGNIFNLPYTMTATLTVLMTGIVGFSALAAISWPLDRGKTILICTLALIFIGIFLGFNHIFKLQSLLSWSMFIYYVPLGLSAVPVFILMREVLGKRIFSRINWR
ncbi:cation-translocating P-type ATPase [Agrilactobacillus fermenti]|uniref:cation-translocating P-type ATPase n=1 Tax=Agrilactobacillus fermenti TaxID=2586909 RepID=UPI001E65B237|nr:cation-translocating P-type ATPase [Agrilactobacillus fermenti]MCD2256162.1 cation-translocating P-type ATPase [Agrilactobacillus fermenti]